LHYRLHTLLWTLLIKSENVLAWLLSTFDAYVVVCGRYLGSVYVSILS